MSIIVTDTYPVHTIVTEGYTQAPCPAPVAPAKAQQDFDAMDLQSLADAIQARTGTTFTTGAQLLEERQAEEEEAKRQQRIEEECDLDMVSCGEIRSAIAAGDHVAALLTTSELWSADLKAAHMRGIIRYFKLVCCPACGGQGWLPGNQHGDVECTLCDETGYALPEDADGFMDDLAAHQNTNVA